MEAERANAIFIGRLTVDRVLVGFYRSWLTALVLNARSDIRLAIIDRVRRPIPQGRGWLASRNGSADRGRELMASGPPPLELSLN